MPPRKSNVSTVSTDEPASKSAPQDGLSVEDLALPRTMVQRLAKGVLPANTIIQKDALLAMSKSATVFINYLTSAANENAMRSNKKTIQPKDVLDAMRDLEFEGFLPRLEAELQKFNSIQCDKRNTYRKKVREAKNAADTSESVVVVNGNAKEEDSPPAAKKARRSSGAADDQASGDEDEDNEDQVEDEQHESEPEEEEEEEGEGPEELTEDPLEVKEQEEEEGSEGEESD